MHSELNILIGCEESQVICQSFQAAGYLATRSCDILPTRGNPDWHIQGDIVEVVARQDWDLVILHPPCTALANSGNRTYGVGQKLHFARQRDLAWTLDLWELTKKHSRHAAIENPISVLFKHIGYMFYCQPYQFGHGETKQTGFGMHNLKPLRSTNIVSGRRQVKHKLCPSKTRQRDRSTTYQGIADAIVSQWGNYVLESRGVIL